MILRWSIISKAFSFSVCCLMLHYRKGLLSAKDTGASLREGGLNSDFFQYNLLSPFVATPACQPNTHLYPLYTIDLNFTG